MSPIDDLNVQPIEQRLADLQQRQRHLTIWFVFFTTFALVTVASLFVQKEFIYRFFDLSLHVQTLDLPYSVQELVPFKQPVDYFFNLLSWVGWLFLKIFASFIGAFLLLSWVKRIKFFKRRLNTWTQRILAWVIAFIILWSGLSYLQYDWKDETEQAYQQWMSYNSNIVESQIAQDLQHARVSPNEKAYVLAQVALNHRPLDRQTANVYVNQLINAEKNNPTQFKDYDFKPEQLWTMQRQLYGKSVTSITQSLEARAQQAEKTSQIVKMLLLGFSFIFISLSILLYILAKHLKTRRQRIVQKLHRID
ncbi:hypothetical protein [Acinetobacter haemolyticus]|uniref:hypothetical protein n=1 Tax=Acinetobacter haemolyticus TaxID=29430 RepID=UPI000D6921F7|nr:hypothetical protein [Acinetobacter haemolyticus]